MSRLCYWILPIAFILFAGSSCQFSLEGRAATSAGDQYEDLVALFKQFRQLQKPVMVDGIPDYTPRAMRKQRRQLRVLRRRLDAMHISRWPVSQQVDYHLVRAEMNGLEFNHRVLRPWSRDPGFYSTIERFEQTQAGALKIPDLPIDANKVEPFQVQLRTVPAILRQAKSNLTAAAGDLALLAIRRKQRESRKFRELIEGLQKHHPDLVPDAEKALAAIEDFRDWLKDNKSRMTAPAGIGIDNYNWYLKNVYLFPYTWQQCLTIAQREYQRCVARLKWEEHRNRHLPPLTLAATIEDYKSRLDNSQQFLMDFLRENQILPQPDYLHLKPARPHKLPRENLTFFQHVLVRDPLALQPHDFVGHSPDEARFEHENHPIRRGYHLFHISGIRAEALATGIEEMLMHTGLMDERPRSRELTYMLRIFRAVRAMADLKMHSGQMSLEEAIRYCAENVPYGWVEQGNKLIWDDLEIYIRQPGYGMGYLVGAVQFENLLAERAMQLGEDFTVQRFMQEFLDSGMAPLALIRWEMTGFTDEITNLW